MGSRMAGMHTKVEYGAGGGLVNGSCFTIEPFAPLLGDVGLPVGLIHCPALAGATDVIGAVADIVLCTVVHL